MPLNGSKKDFFNIKSESEVAQSCLTLCDPMDSETPPGSSIRGIFQARRLEWVGISFSSLNIKEWIKE